MAFVGMKSCIPLQPCDFCLDDDGVLSVTSFLKVLSKSQRKMFLLQSSGTFLDIFCQHFPDDVPLIQSMDKD